VKSLAGKFALIGALVALASCSPNGIPQVNSSAKAQHSKAVRVPFIGCASDGQVGRRDAPKSASKVVIVSAQDAQKLAYYQAEEGLGALAPRGWYCFSTYGSNGSSLFVSSEPIKSSELFSVDWKGFRGSVIQVSTLNGDTSGRFEVARIIARVFPAHRAFVDDVLAEKVEPASDFPAGPFLTDRLTYHGTYCVEYWTPANTEGLGSESRLKKSDEPISGVAVLFGEELNLAYAAIRLPRGSVELGPAIVRQLRYDVSSLPLD
jgi:hypothetical protein